MFYGYAPYGYNYGYCMCCGFHSRCMHCGHCMCCGSAPIPYYPAPVPYSNEPAPYSNMPNVPHFEKHYEVKKDGLKDGFGM